MRRAFSHHPDTPPNPRWLSILVGLMVGGLAISLVVGVAEVLPGNWN